MKYRPNKITVCVQCHLFQHRLSWMLSSLADQSVKDRIVVSVAYATGDGEPKTEDILNLYENDLEIVRLEYKSVAERFQYRGYVRTDQMKKCDTEWILFADSDMVYCPTFFEELLNFLSDSPTKGNFFSCGRYSTTLDETEDLIGVVAQETNGYTKRVTRAYERSASLESNKKSNVGAGFNQIINMIHCPHDGYYVEEAKSKDRAWYAEKTQGQKARSDQQFRKRIKKTVGHTKLSEWFSRGQIHLQHFRDNEFGYHLELQR